MLESAPGTLQVDPDQAVRPRNPTRPRIPRWLTIGLCLLIIAIAAGGITLTRLWPFTRENTIAKLKEVTSSDVQIKSFRKTYSPPGCIAEGVTLTPAQSPASGATAQIQVLTIRSSYAALLTRRVQLALDGAVITLPPPAQGTGFELNNDAVSSVVVDQISAKNSRVQFLSHDRQKPPIKFDVHEFVVRDPGTKSAMKFEAKLRNPEPPGEADVSGSIGPWRSDDSAQTPVAGNYFFEHADLGVFGGIQGTLSSKGKFAGKINHIEVQGSTDTPNFEVTRSGHKTRLTTNFHALVNGTNGDVVLGDVHAAFGKTNVASHGTIEGDEGKTAGVKLSGDEGRIQDVLMMFITAPVSPMTGTVRFSANAKIPNDWSPFLRNVQLGADFYIDNGQFTNGDLQSEMNQLSHQAQGQKPKDEVNVAVSTLAGHVELRDGVANFSDLKFRLPGATAHLHGTYDVVTEAVNLQGLLLMQADLPHATSGFKSVLLKPINVFLRKNHHGGARIPVIITGTYDHPVCKTDPM